MDDLMKDSIISERMALYGPPDLAHEAIGVCKAQYRRLRAEGPPSHLPCQHAVNHCADHILERVMRLAWEPVNDNVLDDLVRYANLLKWHVDRGKAGQ